MAVGAFRVWNDSRGEIPFQRRILFSTLSFCNLISPLKCRVQNRFHTLRFRGENQLPHTPYYFCVLFFFQIGYQQTPPSSHHILTTHTRHNTHSISRNLSTRPRPRVPLRRSIDLPRRDSHRKRRSTSDHHSSTVTSLSAIHTPTKTKMGKIQK